MSRKRTKSESGFHHEGGFSAIDGHQSEVHDDPEVTPVLSYASKLRNSAADSMADVGVELSDADCCFSQGKEGMGLCFSEHARKVLTKSWKSAVVVRLMGKPNSVSSFDFMLRSLRRKWRSNGGWKLIDLLNDWFIVKFELEEDMEDVLCGGPWIIAGQTLVVKRWSASFDPVNDEVGSMAVWARIVGLPVLYFADFAMQKIGQLLGEVVKVDAVTLGQERGRFARVCVEMDLSKPFKSSVVVDNVCYKVQYEGLSLLCFSCGVYGHTKEKCPAVCASSSDDMDQSAVKSPCAQVGGVVEGCDGDTDMGLANGSSPNDSGVFGPWMLVNYKTKKKSGKDNVGAVSAQGSRFAVLQGEVAEETQVDSVEAGVPSDVAGNGKELSGEAGKVWTFLQNKIKDRDGGGTVLEMENNNGAYIWPKERGGGSLGGLKHSIAPRVPLIDLSNAGNAKGKGNVKIPRKAYGGVLPGVNFNLRQPFMKSVDLSSSSFSGYFGRGPIEEGVFVDDCLGGNGDASDAGAGCTVDANAGDLDKSSEVLSSDM